MLPARIASKIRESADGCWLWTACANARGYGRVRWAGKSQFAHRVVYELLRGPIPPGLCLDHLCRVHGCVNPRHLRPVTHRENMLAPGSTAVSARNAAKTHCPRGHALELGNLLPSDLARGHRRCLICNRNAKRETMRERARLRKQRRAETREFVHRLLSGRKQ